MSHLPHFPVVSPRLSLLAVALLASLQANAQSSSDTNTDSTPTDLDKVLVVAQRAERVSKGATGLDLDIKDTPQSISLVSAGQMRDFGADNIDDALRLATGINVEEWETNRTNYTARGFDIVNTQVDGVGMPNDWGIVTGAFDAFGYEKIEVIRGANGQLTGVGNASGTINYVRKRPTNERQGEFNVKLGSWGNTRAELDYSTPLTGDERWAGRVVAAWEDGDSYLDLLHEDRAFLYGVVDGQLGENATLTLGYSHQKANADSPTWGGLPFAYSDGTQAEWPRNTTISQDWAYWNTVNQTAFAELTYALPNDWQLKGTYNFRKSTEDESLFYAWAGAGLDPVTHEGIQAYPGWYAANGSGHFGEVSVSGHFTAFGREHEAVLGYAQSYGSLRYSTRDPVNDVEAGDPDPYMFMPPFPYAGNAMPEPIWGTSYEYQRGSQWLRRAYGAVRLGLTDRVKAIVGFNHTYFHRKGEDIYGGPYDQSQGKLSPYAGLTVDVTDNALLYASYSDIYQPQDQQDINHQYLDPTKGVNYEVGAKAEWFGRRLLTTLAWFSARQENLATESDTPAFIDTDGDGVDDDFFWYYYGASVNSKGWEFEATGKLNDHVEVVFGYTALKLTSPQGDDVYPWVPRHTANLAVSAALPSLPQLRFGVSGRWQSEVWNYDDALVAEIHQRPYAVLNAFGEWNFNNRVSLRANVNNITDRTYISSVYWVGYYGAPRNYSLSLNWKL
ncbi:MAG: TonB-dependent siderophore receptor [Thermomonas sp.]|uniref:TonB-dependent siderophore receptor n=1 Tax=Thermomonas sp. TaxID=1971895 RepID=UPI0039E5C501